MKKYLTIIFLLFLNLYSQAQTQIPTQINTRKAIEIDGQVNFIGAGTNNRNISSAVTLEAWVRTNQIHNQWVVGKKNATGGFSLEIQNGRAVFIGASGTITSSGLSQTVVNDNKWHHLAGTYQAGTWQIWVDGVQENTSVIGGPAATLTSNAPLIFARDSLDPARYFKGFIGEVKLWNTVRTENQLRTFMAKVISMTSPDLVGYFRCDNTLLWPTPPPHLTDFSDLQLHGLINAGIIKYSAAAPPVGDESIFYYGTDLNSKHFKLTGQFADTVTIQNISGNAKGIHLYTSYTSYSYTGQVPPKRMVVSYYYGMLAVGDTSATYKVKFRRDTTTCNLDVLLYARKDTRTLFSKVQPGRYNPAVDTLTQYIAKDRGELAFVLPFPDVPVLKAYSGIIAKCPENRPTMLTATKGHFFLWNTGERTKSIQVNQTGKYWVKISDFCTEIGSDTFRVEIAPPIKLPTLKSTDTIICDNEPLKLKMPAGFIYQWPDGSAADSFFVSTAGTYQVTVTDPRCGNSVSSSIRVKTVPCNPEKVFIPNIITPNQDGRNDFFIPIGLPAGSYGLTIYNRWGKQVYQSFNYKNNWQAEGLKAGIYYYLFQNAHSGKSYKGYVEVMK